MARAAYSDGRYDTDGSMNSCFMSHRLTAVPRLLYTTKAFPLLACKHATSNSRLIVNQAGLRGVLYRGSITPSLDGCVTLVDGLSGGAAAPQDWGLMPPLPADSPVNIVNIAPRSLPLL